MAEGVVSDGLVSDGLVCAGGVVVLAMVGVGGATAMSPTVALGRAPHALVRGVTPTATATEKPMSATRTRREVLSMP